MIRNIAGIFLVIAATLIFVACNDEPGSQPPAEPAQPAAEAPAAAEHDSDGNTDHPGPAGDVDTEAHKNADSDTESHGAEETAKKPAAAPRVEPGAAAEDTAKSAVAADTEPANVEPAKSEPFTATTGLADFSAYRLKFATEFDGTRAGQPAAGTLNGAFEVTKPQNAQHWKLEMTGDVFQELAVLGGSMELYNIADTIYIQNPGDNSWIGIPAMLVESMLPAEMYNPEDSIELPANATRQPGTEMVNGVESVRYTFGKDDLSGDTANLESVEGTVWVAAGSGTVVRYQAKMTGTFTDLTAGGIKLLDEGTITMRYDVTDTNGDFSIRPPEGATAVDLTKLLFN